MIFCFFISSLVSCFFVLDYVYSLSLYTDSFFFVILYQHATHTVVFSQLKINGNDEGVHAFTVQIRDDDGNICPNIRIADCGHKIGLNGVDNGRIW